MLPGKRQPAAVLTNAELPEGDKPPAEPSSSPKIALPDGWWDGSAGGIIARLKTENAALRAEIVRLLAEVARRSEKGGA